MIAIDNSELVAPFMPDEDDGDTFLYTELLNRAEKAGGNRMRLLRTFFHRSRTQFEEQLPTIRRLCDATGVRAMTRLAPRSYKKVGKLFITLAVEASLVEHWQDMASIYASACGRSAPTYKLWLFDVDGRSEHSALREHLEQRETLVAALPSKSGVHYVSEPFDIGGPIARIEAEFGVSVHKDNPTNLYIPEGSA